MNSGKIENPTLFLYGVVALAALITVNRVFGTAKEAAEAAAEFVVDDALPGITPTNPENIFHRGVNATGAALTGNESFALGSFIFDILNPGE